MTHPNGFQVRLRAQGAAIEGIRVPLHDGPVEAVLDYDDASLQARDPYYLGVTCGRFANRIARASLRIGHERFELAPTPGQGGHALHGGASGFSHRTWERLEDDDQNQVTYRLVSPAGDQGFPGTLTARVRYRLLDGWALAIDMEAHTDAMTVVNLVNHAYFNLSDRASSGQEHWAWIDADRYTPVGTDMIPTGEQARVEGTPFDLRRPENLGARAGLSHPQLERAGGFDHNFVLRGATGTLRKAGGLLAPDTGLRLTVLTTAPGLQLYGGQHLAAPFRPGQGICLEAQGFPDAPNQPGFPSAQLAPGRRWTRQVVYRFDRII